MSPLDCFNLLPGESFKATVQGGGKITEETEFVVQRSQDSQNFLGKIPTRLLLRKHWSSAGHPVRPLSTNMHLHLRKPPKARKEPLERRRQNNMELTQCWKLYSCQPEWKDLSAGHCIETLEGIALIVVPNQIQTRGFCEPTITKLTSKPQNDLLIPSNLTVS